MKGKEEDEKEGRGKYGVGGRRKDEKEGNGMDEMEGDIMTVELIKLVIFVPISHAEAVRKALGEAGAGHIGNYDFCSFSVRGTGRFRPGRGTNPFLGTEGEIEEVEEERIETICPRQWVKEIIESVRRVHPYEEMAYDMYPLLNLEIE